MAWQACATCLYALAVAGEALVECHRHAPTADTLPKGLGPQPPAVWPAVDPNRDGCGEGDPKV